MVGAIAGGISFFFFNDTATTEIYTLSLHDALPIFFDLVYVDRRVPRREQGGGPDPVADLGRQRVRSEEHTSELQSRLHLVCRLLLEKKKDTYVRSILYTAIAVRYASSSSGRSRSKL